MVWVILNHGDVYYTTVYSFSRSFYPDQLTNEEHVNINMYLAMPIFDKPVTEILYKQKVLH